MRKEYEIKARDFLRAGEGSIKVQSTLKAIGIDPKVIRRASICASESEMNVVMYGSDGTISLTVDTDAITIEVRDHGSGIDDIDLALQEGFGAGMGLPNIKKNADSFEIHSRKDKGTYLKICFWVTRNREQLNTK